jgi:hypothetical protein
MAVYSKLILVTENTYPEEPQIVLPFEPASITAQVMANGMNVSISFGDKQDAAVLIGDVLSPGSYYDWTSQRWVKNIYLKALSPTTIQIIAEE